MPDNDRGPAEVDGAARGRGTYWQGTAEVDDRRSDALPPGATVVRPVAGRLTVTYPGDVDPRAWLFALPGGPRTFARVRPGEVTVPRAALPGVVAAVLAAFGPVELLLDGYARRACTARCQRATGPACECSCLGRHHGDADAWRVAFGVPRPAVDMLGWVEPGRSSAAASCCPTSTPLQHCSAGRCSTPRSSRRRHDPRPRAYRAQRSA